MVSVHWSNLRDPEVNARFNGMHAIAAKALETTTKAIPNIPEFLPIVDVLSAAMSNVVTSGATIPEALNGAASQAPAHHPARRRLRRKSFHSAASRRCDPAPLDDASTSRRLSGPRIEESGSRSTGDVGLREEPAHAMNHRKLALILLAPAMLLVAFTTIYPMVSSFWTSFHILNLARSLDLGRFVGLENYTEAFRTTPSSGRSCGSPRPSS